MPPGDSVEKPSSPAVMSPQQIMRARYKQQMMPPRTWKQQQAREEQIEALNKARGANNRSIYTAAAAKASSLASKPKAATPSSVASAGPQRRRLSTDKKLSVTTNRRLSNASTSSVSSSGLPRGPSLSPLSPSSRRRASQSSIIGSAKDAAAASAKEYMTSVNNSTPANGSFSFSAYRPPMQRRGSSASSLSRAAAMAAQSPAYRPQNEAPSSRISSLSSSSRRNSAATITSIEPATSPRTLHAKTSQDSLMFPDFVASGPGNTTSALPRQKPPSPSTTEVQYSAATITSIEPATSPRTLHAKTSQDSLMFPDFVASGPGNTTSALPRQKPPSPSTTEVQYSAASQPSKPRMRTKMQASAAARASASNPISVQPRVPLSAKFVSSLSQALRNQQEQRRSNIIEEERRLEAIRNLETASFAHNPALAAASSRNSTDSTRSIGSVHSGKSYRSHQSHQSHRSGDNNYTISTDSFAELHSQQQQHQQHEMERMRKTAEENKANALHAAVSAGNKVEADMANIHIQVNQAVQDALQRRNRSNIMKKYRPAASWSAPARMLRPQLRRLQTHDSAKQPISFPSWSGDPKSAAATDTSGTSHATHHDISWESSPSNAERATPASPYPSTYPESHSRTSSVNSLGLPEKGEVSNKFPISLSSSQPRTPLPWSQFSLRSKPRPIRTRERETPSHHPMAASPADSFSSSIGTASPDRMPLGLESSPSSSSLFTQSSNNLFEQPVRNPVPRMPKTLRGSVSGKRFNEEKPWKGHREISELSERERKRYESLWAANRDTHLPYLYVPAKYQKAWDEAVAESFPNLMKNKTSPPPHIQNKPTHKRLPSQSLHSVKSHQSAPSVSSVNSTHSFQSASWAPDSESTDSHTQVAPNRIGTPDTTESYQDSFNVHAVPRSDNESIGDDHENAEIESTEEEADYVDMKKEVENRSDEVHGYVVARLWRRSRLQEDTLAQIWDLVDTNKDGTLERSGFVVGMWLCDQCLYGRKLPRKVPPEVWQSVGKLNLKIRVKQKRSKIGYVRRLPNLFGSAVGYTMHGGRQAVKKAVQTATK